MKQIIVTVLLVIVAATAGAQETREKKPTDTAGQRRERTIALWGHVKNSLTRVGIPDVRVTLMRSDSTVVDTMHVFKQWAGGGKDDYAYRFQIPAHEEQYIIRAEHPDYETTDIRYHVHHIARNDYFDAPWHYMKKKSQPDLMPVDSLMEGSMREVVVQATKIKMTYNGDTITFNADAFNLPEGSMLDALIRQMDGVELKDDGRILVHGEQVDELMLNGKDFFKGNNRVMLDNLPAYTVQRVQTYHKETELDHYLGRNYDKKRFVMDVQLKREYNKGWLANVEGAGGWKDGSQGEVNTNSTSPYLARLFAMRYTDNSRLSVYANANNVNENRRPGSDGEWSPSNQPQGLQENRIAGVNLFIEEKDKRWKEDARVDVAWRRTTDETLVATEQFHTNSPSTYNRLADHNRNRNLSLNAYNVFQLNKPLFLYSAASLIYSDATSHSRTRSAQFSSDPARYGATTALLDSVFAATLSTDMQQTLIHNSLHSAQNNGHNLWLQTENMLTKKLASGDNVGVELNASYNRGRSHRNSEEQLRYQLTPSLNSLLNRHSSRPSSETNVSIAPHYRITWLNGLWLNTEYRFLFRQRDNTNDVYLADTLDLQNAYDRTHRRVENRLALTPGYSYDRDGTYIRAYYQMHFFNVNERLDYRSAYADTTLTQHKWTMSPELHVQVATHNWAHSYDIFYGIEFQTPDLFQKVNILNDENPLVRRYGNPHLRGATNHRMQFGINRNWRERRISERFGGGLRFFRHQVSQGQAYDPTTGITTYRPENVEGNWQTYFFNFYNMPLDRPRRLMLNIYTHGDYTRNVDMLNGLSHVNNYYIENRLTLSYTWRNLTLGLPTNVEFRHTTNEEHTIETINAWNFQYGLTVNYNFKREESSAVPRWLQGFTLATDLKMYSRRGYGDRSLNRNDLVWNASVARSFPRPFGRKAGGTLIARLEGFDILGQLSSTNIVINGQGRTETVYNTLPRYLMLHLVYQWAKQPKKK
ncbi:MAG: hypothetical protein IJ064_05245 [Bacteroidaceae bacterium]|nr:hypothetical protein [Bacteroidaceae bacterium]